VSPGVGVVVDRVRIAEAGAAERAVVDDVTFEVPPGGTVGIAGESGCGKTALVQALFGYARTGLVARGGTVSFTTEGSGGPRDARPLTVMGGDGEFAGVRGRVIALVPQAASSVLDPIMRIGRQLEEIAACVVDADAEDVEDVVRAGLADVGFSDPDLILKRYPHQISGGQRQRIALSMALLARPDVLVLDEATTDLDVITQRRILELIKALRWRYGFAVVAVSHDLRVLAELCSHLLVMYRGRVVESGPTAALLAAPRHPYSARLVARFEQGPLAGGLGDGAAVDEVADGCAYRAHCPLNTNACEVEPDLIAVGDAHASRCWEHHKVVIAGAGDAPSAAVGCNGSPAAVLLSVAGLRASHREPGLLSRRVVPVLHGIDLDVMAGESLGIVGESGSGKTTLARILVGLHPMDAGHATFLGRSLDVPAVRRELALRRDLQIVFQSPEMAFNPRLRIGDALARRLKVFEGLQGVESHDRIAELLADVGLPASHAEKLPSQLSGGERQRIAIARALIGGPRLIVCDEVVSALDVESQARVVRVLKRLQAEQGLSYIFISHDMGVVAAVADRLAVFKDGCVVEVGPTARVLEQSDHPYTRALASAAFVDVEHESALSGGNQ